MPEAPQTTCIPARTSAIGSVRTREVGALAVDDQAAVHLGVLAPRTQWPSSRTWVSRLVVE